MIFFVIGGSGSGKSEYAENLTVKLKEKESEQLVYVATMKPLDEESWKRIGRHRNMRAGKGFETRECYTHLEQLTVNQHEIILLECLSNLTANEMFSENGRKEEAAFAIQKGLLCLAENCRHLVIVGNNVFEDGMEYDEMTMEYLRQMARLHRFLGEISDSLTEVIFGIPVEWKKRDTENQRIP